MHMSTHEYPPGYEQCHMTIYGRAMTQGISDQLRRRGFNYRPVYVGFEKGKWQVKQVSCRYFGFPLSSLHQCSVTIHLSVTEAMYLRK